MVIAYIDAYRERVVEGRKLGVEPICVVLNEAGVRIAPRTYWASKQRVPPTRAVRDEELKTTIQRVFHALTTACTGRGRSMLSCGGKASG